MAGGAIRATALDFLEYRTGRRQIHAGAIVLLRNQHRQVTGVGERLHKFGRVSLVSILVAPVFIGIVPAQARDRIADFRV